MEQLGIQPIQLLMQAVNFAVLVILLTKFLYKPVLKLINERKKKIKEGLNLRDRMEVEKEKLDELKRQKIDQGMKEARKIIKEARNQAKIQQNQIIADAKKSIEEMNIKAEREIALKKKQLEAKVRKEAVDLATEIAEKVLTDLLSDKENQRKILRKRLQLLSQLKHEI